MAKISLKKASEILNCTVSHVYYLIKHRVLRREFQLPEERKNPVVYEADVFAYKSKRKTAMLKKSKK